MNFRLLKGSKIVMSAGLWGGSGAEEGPGWRPRFRSHESGGGDQRWSSGDRPESREAPGTKPGGTVTLKGLRAEEIKRVSLKVVWCLRS